MSGPLSMRLLRAALAPAVALCLFVSAAASPSRASDLVDCVSGWAKTAMDPEAIKDALEFLKDYGECIPSIADPSGKFAAVTGALLIAKSQGAFTTAQDCENKISSLLVQVVLEVANSVGDVIGFKIPPAIQQQGSSAVADWILQQAGQNPVIQSIMAEMKCGCGVAAYGSENLEKILNEVVDTAEACAGVIGDIAQMGEEIADAVVDGLEDAAEDIEKIGDAVLTLVEDCLSSAAGQKSVIDCLEDIPDLADALGALLGSAAGTVGDFLDALGGFLGFVKAGCCATAGQIWGGFCGGCDPPPKPQQPQVNLNCQGVICEKGLQCGGALNDRCVPCSESVQHGNGKTPGMCGCNQGFTPTYASTAGGPVLTACTCHPPLAVKPIIFFAVCACPVQGQSVQYKNGNMLCDCKWGESLQGGKCEPIKCASYQGIAADGKTCVQFEPISLKDQPTPVLSADPIIPCPPNYRKVGNNCVYSGGVSIGDQPPPVGVPVPVAPDCPLNTYWDGADCRRIPTRLLDPRFKAAPIIPPCVGNTRWDGRRCVPIATRTPGPGTLTTVPQAPPCPDKTKWDGRRCVPVVTRVPGPATVKIAPTLVPSCPGNTKWDGRRCAPVVTRVPGPATVKIAPTLPPPCPDNTKWDGRRCAPPATRLPLPKTFKAIPVTPSCPLNTRWDGKSCAPQVQQLRTPLAVPQPLQKTTPPPAIR